MTTTTIPTTVVQVRVEQNDIVGREIRWPPRDGEKVGRLKKDTRRPRQSVWWQSYRVEALDSGQAKTKALFAAKRRWPEKEFPKTTFNVTIVEDENSPAARGALSID